MSRKADNETMSDNAPNSGFATVADLAVILDEKPSVIAAAIAEIGIVPAVALWPDESPWADGIFSADAIAQLERHFAAQREPA